MDQVIFHFLKSRSSRYSIIHRRVTSGRKFKQLRVTRWNTAVIFRLLRGLEELSAGKSAWIMQLRALFHLHLRTIESVFPIHCVRDFVFFLHFFAGAVQSTRGESSKEEKILRTSFEKFPLIVSISIISQKLPSRIWLGANFTSDEFDFRRIWLAANLAFGKFEAFSHK